MDLSDRPASASPLRGRPMELYDPRLLRLLTFLTRRQGWLSPTEISRDFRLDGEIVSKRTLHRWFLFLRARAALVYYPYPRANVLGLQDVLVRLHGLHEAAILGVMPFGSSFNAEVALGSGHPFVSQGYWVPGDALGAFREYWRAAHELGHVQRVDVFPAQNTHYIYSPFHETIRQDGTAEVAGELDNDYFEMLLTAHMREPFEVRLSIDRPFQRMQGMNLLIEFVNTSTSSVVIFWDERRFFQ